MQELRTLVVFGTADLRGRRFCLEEFVVYSCSYGITEHSAGELCGRLKVLRRHLVARNDAVVYASARVGVV